MVKTMISAKGSGRLHIVEGNMRNDQYVKILRSKVLSQANQWFQNGDFICMHGSAPCHMQKGH